MVQNVNNNDESLDSKIVQLQQMSVMGIQGAVDNSVYTTGNPSMGNL